MIKKKTTGRLIGLVVSCGGTAF